MNVKARVFAGIVLGSVVFLVAALYLLGGNLGRLIRNGLVVYGPASTGTEWNIADIDISPWGGEGDIIDLRVANPEGYVRPIALEVPRIRVDVETFSYFEQILVVERFRLDDAVIYLDLSGQEQFNLRVLADRIASAEMPAEVELPSRQEAILNSLIVRRFELRNARVVVHSGLVGKKQRDIPNLVIRDIGADVGGVTVVEAIRRTLGPALTEAMRLAGEKVLEKSDELRERFEETLEQIEQGAEETGEPPSD